MCVMSTKEKLTLLRYHFIC